MDGLAVVLTAGTGGSSPSWGGGGGGGVVIGDDTSIKGSDGTDSYDKGYGGRGYGGGGGGNSGGRGANGVVVVQYCSPHLCDGTMATLLTKFPNTVASPAGLGSNSTAALATNQCVSRVFAVLFGATSVFFLSASPACLRAVCVRTRMCVCVHRTTPLL